VADGLVGTCKLEVGAVELAHAVVPSMPANRT